MKLVKDVMVSDVVCVSPFAKLREALSLMKNTTSNPWWWKNSTPTTPTD